jgi:predicted transcriptional regulator of viral defense system
MDSELPGSLPPTFSTRQALALGTPEHVLRRWLAEGMVERIAQGLYRRTDADPAEDDMIEIAFRAPHATLCLETAMSMLDLSDLIPSRPDVAVPRGDHIPPVRIRVAWHKFDPATFSIGRETTTLDPVTTIGIYNAERSIIDAIRLRHKIGAEVAYQAIRRYLRQRGPNTGPLMEMARHFPAAEPELRRILEIRLS